MLEAACVKQLIQLSGALIGGVPCSSDSLVGSIVLIIFYGYLLLRGARLLSDGSELLLEVISPGIIGGENPSASASSLHPLACNNCNHHDDREIVQRSTYIEGTTSCISCGLAIGPVEVALHRHRVLQA